MLAQHVGVGAHRGGLPGSGGADPGQQQPLIAGERGHQRPLPVIQPGPGDGLEPVQRGGHRRAGQGIDRGGAGGVQQPLLGIQHRLAGVPPGGVLGEHRLAVCAAQLRWLVQQGGGLRRDRVPGGDRQGGDGVGQVAVASGVEAGDLGADEAGPQQPPRLVPPGHQG